MSDLADWFGEWIDGDDVVDERHVEGGAVVVLFEDGTKFAITVQQLD